MSRHREIEIKWALDENGYKQLEKRLRGVYGEPRVLEQHNRFFDAGGVLRAKRMNLRLRQENGKLLMTCKRRSQTQHDNIHDHDEWEEWLDPAIWDAAAEGLAELLPLPAEFAAVIVGKTLSAVGGFANHRLEFAGGDELICLDRTDFNGRRVDYELEIETSRAEAAAVKWNNQLADWKITATPQTESKFARLLSLSAER